MLLSSGNVEDIRRYYVGTIVKFKETGDMLYQLTTANNFYVEGLSQNGDILKLYLDEQHPYEMEYVLPHKSYFQVNKCAAQLYRIPAKQYQRGIGTDNTEIRVIQRGDFSKLPILFDTLIHFVNKQKFFSLQQAVDAEGMESCVLTPRMAYCRYTNVIYVDLTAVATVEGKTVVMSKKVFTNEVEEMLSQHNEGFKVIS